MGMPHDTMDQKYNLQNMILDMKAREQGLYLYGKAQYFNYLQGIHGSSPGVTAIDYCVRKVEKRTS